MGRRVGAIARYKQAVRKIRRDRARGIPPAPPPEPPPPVRYWWQEREDDPVSEAPTEFQSGRRIRAVRDGYEGEPFKYTAMVGGERVLIGWTRAPQDAETLAKLETLGYGAPRYAQVRNRKTGDA